VLNPVLFILLLMAAVSAGPAEAQQAQGTGERAVALTFDDLPATRSGRLGLSWIQRWAITRGDAPGQQPSVPHWVTRASLPQ
jgi:hypothetical protein